MLRFQNTICTESKCADSAVSHLAHKKKLYSSTKKVNHFNMISILKKIKIKITTIDTEEKKKSKKVYPCCFVNLCSRSPSEGEESTVGRKGGEASHYYRATDCKDGLHPTPSCQPWIPGAKD